MNNFFKRISVGTVFSVWFSIFLVGCGVKDVAEITPTITPTADLKYELAVEKSFSGDSVTYDPYGLRTETVKFVVSNVSSLNGVAVPSNLSTNAFNFTIDHADALDIFNVSNNSFNFRLINAGYGQVKLTVTPTDSRIHATNYTLTTRKASVGDFGGYRLRFTHNDNFIISTNEKNVQHNLIPDLNPLFGIIGVFISNVNDSSVTMPPNGSLRVVNNSYLLASAGADTFTNSYQVTLLSSNLITTNKTINLHVSKIAPGQPPGTVDYNITSSNTYVDNGVATSVVEFMTTGTFPTNGTLRDGRAASISSFYVSYVEYGSIITNTSTNFTLRIPDQHQSLRLDGLKPATRYTFAVIAVNNAGLSSIDRVYKSITTPPPPTPPAVFPVRAEPVTGNPKAVQVSWTIPSNLGNTSGGGADTFGSATVYIKRRTDNFIGYGTEVFTANTNVTTNYLITGLDPETTYSVKVRIENSSGLFHEVEASVTTPSMITPNTAANRFIATNFSFIDTGSFNYGEQFNYKASEPPLGYRFEVGTNAQGVSLGSPLPPWLTGDANRKVITINEAPYTHGIVYTNMSINIIATNQYNSATNTLRLHIYVIKSSATADKLTLVQGTDDYIQATRAFGNRKFLMNLFEGYKEFVGWDIARISLAIASATLTIRDLDYFAADVGAGDVGESWAMADGQPVPAWIYTTNISTVSGVFEHAVVFPSLVPTNAIGKTFSLTHTYLANWAKPSSPQKLDITVKGIAASKEYFNKTADFISHNDFNSSVLNDTYLFFDAGTVSREKLPDKLFVVSTNFTNNISYQLVARDGVNPPTWLRTETNALVVDATQVVGNTVADVRVKASISTGESAVADLRVAIKSSGNTAPSVANLPYVTDLHMSSVVCGNELSVFRPKIADSDGDALVSVEIVGIRATPNLPKSAFGTRIINTTTAEIYRTADAAKLFSTYNSIPQNIIMSIRMKDARGAYTPVVPITAVVINSFEPVAKFANGTTNMNVTNGQPFRFRIASHRVFPEGFSCGSGVVNHYTDSMFYKDFNLRLADLDRVTPLQHSSVPGVTDIPWFPVSSFNEYFIGTVPLNATTGTFRFGVRDRTAPSRSSLSTYSLTVYPAP